jgi:SAM-dependent methyltransferase
MAARYYYFENYAAQIEEVVQLFLAKSLKNLPLQITAVATSLMSQSAPFVAQYLGIDLELNPIADIHIAPTGAIQLDAEKLDVVLSTQVLEHVVDPKQYLQEAHRVLKNDGLLILSTHGYWMFHPDPTDFWRWTSTGLRKVVEDEGFEVVYFKGIIGRAAMGLQLFQDGLLFKLPKFLRPILAIIMQPQIIFFDKITAQDTIDKDACTYVLGEEKIVFILFRFHNFAFL